MFVAVSHGVCACVDELWLILRQNRDQSEKIIKTKLHFIHTLINTIR